MRNPRTVVVLALLAVFAAGSPAQGYVLQTMPGPTAAALGFALAAVPDIDGDGRPDLVAAQPGTVGRGVVRLLSGDSGQSLGAFCALQTNEGLGRSLAAAVIDGLPTIAAGAPGYDINFFSEPGGGFDVARIAPRQSLDGSAGEELGASVAGIGDLDGDRIPDAIVGAPGFQSGAVRGRARVI